MDQTTYRIRRRSLLVVSIVLMASLLAPAGPEAGAAAGGSESGAGTTGSSWACAGGGALIGHSRPYLTGFTNGNQVAPFYAAPEGGSLSATLTVTSTDFCDGLPEEGGRARYLTEDGSAVSSGDYQAIPRTWSDYMCVVNDTGGAHRVCAANTQRTRAVPLTLLNDDDSANDSAVESFHFRIDAGDPHPPATFQPFEAPVHIIDTDGPARVSLEPTLDGAETKAYGRGEPSTVDVPVFWAGSGTPGNVNYTVSAGSPAPTVNVDYQVQSENPLPPGAFSPSRAGGRLAFIRIRILNNTGADGKPVKELDEIINISLDPGPGYLVEGAHDATTLTILDGGSDTLAPRTRFHHPKHKKKYRRNAYQLREMHIFYREPGGSGIKKVELAIQRKLKNGKCQWWNGKRFKRDRCKKPPGRFWKNAQYDRFLDWYLYRVPALKPTVRTNIRYYRAFSRGFDHAGNVESRFQKKRNKNKFWIKRR